MANRNTTPTQFSANLLIFKEENYKMWVAQMKVIFRFQDVVEIVNDGVLALEENANNVQQT